MAQFSAKVPTTTAKKTVTPYQSPTQTTTTPTADTQSGSISFVPYSGTESSTGGSSTPTVQSTAYGSTPGFSELVSPWQDESERNYTEAAANPYGAQWQDAVAQAMAVGTKDYTNEMRGFAQEDVEKQIQSQMNTLGSYGMRELGLRADVQTDQAKLRTDASTQASIDAQQLTTNALAAMESMLASASAADLERVAAMISAAESGSKQYNDWQTLAMEAEAKAAADWEKLYEERKAAGMYTGGAS